MIWYVFLYNKLLIKTLLCALNQFTKQVDQLFKKNSIYKHFILTIAT